MPKERYQDIYREFQRIGQATFISGLNNSHSGNMSVRIGERILITRRGSMLGYLKESDIVETGLEKDNSGIALASTEIGVHRAIYKETSALAIVHTHPLAATALSLLQDEIIPLDVEGSYYFHKIPILSFEYSIGSKEMEVEVSRALKNYKVIMVKGHGAFAIGNFLEEALQYSSSLESIAKIIYLVRTMGGDIAKLQKAEYMRW